MKSVTVTYHAPPGDSKVTEVFGQTFFDGKSETLEVEDHVAEKLRSNKHFECSEPKDVQPKPDPKKAKSEDDAAKREDEDKKAAQLPNPPLRGAILHKDEAPAPGQPTPKEEEAKPGAANTKSHDPAQGAKGHETKT